MKRANSTLTFLLLLALTCTLSAQEGGIKGKDGHTYETVKIGSQVWMAENLNTEKVACEGAAKISFANGSERGKDATFQDGKPHFAYYQNRPELEFGALYNQSAILQCDVCPSGYRIPSKAEWEALAQHLGGVDKAGAKLKRGGSSGFNADMMGHLDTSGSALEGKAVSWWAMAEDGSAAYTVELAKDGTLTLYEEGNDKWGNYVRCLKE
ncbi:MAG: fibrobacter succinogenes major paralogous domain-containing protein [Phaeodactylibacter sp.]|uniref:fibrobacter succinogenes major paralogous domain-containing protein n=1 Tax=Phaeodactylibacter sp. TaxID=1940289 RepID=UPI0032ED6D65